MLYCCTKFLTFALLAASFATATGFISSIGGIKRGLNSPSLSKRATRTQIGYGSIDEDAVAERVQRVLKAKVESGLSYDELADKLGITNTHAAQILLGQARLRPATAEKLKAALPRIEMIDLEAMQNDYPMRTFDDEILKEPNVYRTYEAITHYGEAIKSIINEQCGDGIMSAIDFYCDVGTTTGTLGEKRVVITFNGKFLPHIEQLSDNNTARSPRD